MWAGFSLFFPAVVGLVEVVDFFDGGHGCLGSLVVGETFFFEAVVVGFAKDFLGVARHGGLNFSGEVG